MLSETADFIHERYGNSIGIGLLATSGTVTSRVYHAAFEARGMGLIVPDEFHQQKVMSAIYGPLGVKAGHVDGMCKMELLQAVAHLAERGAQVIILGCTELPLVLSQTEAFAVAGATVAILDPTDILARKCASLAHTVAVA
jgi:aspartate racemase